MFPVSRQPRPRGQSIARIFLASLLALALLSGLTPLTALMSWQACDMPCCAGKSAHEKGSCRVAFADELEEEAGAPETASETESLAVLVEEADDASHHHAQHPAHESASNSTARHEEAAHAETHRSASVHSSSAKKSFRGPSLAPTVLTKPCSPECAAAASASTQLRRPRQHAAQAANLRPRPQTERLFVGRNSEPLYESSAARKLSRPRAPPAFLSILPA